MSGGTRGLNAHLVNDWTLLCSAATLPRSVDSTGIFSAMVGISVLVSGTYQYLLGVIDVCRVAFVLKHIRLCSI